MESERPPEGEPFTSIRDTSDVFPTELAEVRRPVHGRGTKRNPARGGTGRRGDRDRGTTRVLREQSELFTSELRAASAPVR